MLSAGDPVRRLRREHGFQLPLHPLQVTGWLALAVLTAGSFLLLVPALPPNWQPAVLATLSTLILLHFVAHLSAAIVDPAEPALRRTVPQPLPELDRTKHAHAIEEGQCHLCRVLTSGPRTKHCSACNKCVARFDHHCKWLNHCVGARNYPPFLMCVSTAVAAAAFVAILAIAELVLHHTNPSWSANSERNVTVPVQQSSLPSSDAAFLAIVAALGLLAAVTAGLLLHLCFFHIYISFLGLTTYEYIRQQRQTQPSSNETPVQVQERCSTFRHRPVNLHCEERSRTTVFTCTVVEETVTCAEPTPTPPSTPQDCQVCVVANNAVAPEQQQVRARKVKQKWNCCLSVPDSPDSPVEPRCLVSLCKHKVRTKTGFPSMENVPHNRTHGHWSSAKLRVLFRVLGNLGHNRRRHSQSNAPRNNQVVPLPSETPSESPVQTISNLVPAQSAPPDSATNAVGMRRTVTLPSLPPPQRRRVISDIELANALTILQQQQQRAGSRRPLPQYRRRRRSNPHRPKTPALSPIRESGLSNPASPSRQNCTVATSCARPF